jgi:hypothetical protein
LEHQVPKQPPFARSISNKEMDDLLKGCPEMVGNQRYDIRGYNQTFERL